MIPGPQLPKVKNRMAEREQPREKHPRRQSTEITSNHGRQKNPHHKSIMLNSYQQTTPDADPIT
jgi:hypothetical protein